MVMKEERMERWTEGKAGPGGFQGSRKEWRNTSVTVISLCIHTREWENLDTSTVPKSQLVLSMSRRYYIVCRQMAIGTNFQAVSWPLARKLGLMDFLLCSTLHPSYT